MHRFKFILESNTDNLCEGVLGFMRNLYSNANAITYKIFSYKLIRLVPVKVYPKFYLLKQFTKFYKVLEGTPTPSETPASAGTSTPAMPGIICSDVGNSRDKGTTRKLL